MHDKHCSTLLSLSVTISQYKRLKEKNNAEGIANLIYDRFHERYIKPFDDNPNKHGFSMMAVGCLMIETLYSFKEGEDNTKNYAHVAFGGFFKKSSYLHEFWEEDKCTKKQGFYKNIRCGILHQAETKNGWKIRRNGPLLDKENKTINATRFLNALHDELKCYVASIKKDSAVYCKAREKLDCICKNCEEQT